MPAINQDLTVEQGADYRARVTWNDSDGQPHDLSDAVAVFTVDDQTHTSTLLTLTDAAGLTLGGANGTIDILIEDAVTAALPAKIARYDLFVTLSGVDRQKIIYGKLIVLAAVPTV